MKTSKHAPYPATALTGSGLRCKFEACLSERERGELHSRECVIAGGLRTFIEVGQALAAIKENRLYRETHRSFEEYCRENWEMSRVHAHRLVTAAEVCALLPDGSTPHPETEAQVRALTCIPREKVPLVWQKVIKLAGEKRITAKIVEAALSDLRFSSNSTANGKGNDSEHWQALVKKEMRKAWAGVKAKDTDIILSAVAKIKVLVEELVLNHRSFGAVD